MTDREFEKFCRATSKILWRVQGLQENPENIIDHRNACAPISYDQWFGTKTGAEEYIAFVRGAVKLQNERVPHAERWIVPLEVERIKVPHATPDQLAEFINNWLIEQ